MDTDRGRTFAPGRSASAWSISIASSCLTGAVGRRACWERRGVVASKVHLLIPVRTMGGPAIGAGDRALPSSVSFSLWSSTADLSRLCLCRQSLCGSFPSSGVRAPSGSDFHPNNMLPLCMVAPRSPRVPTPHRAQLRRSRAGPRREAALIWSTSARGTPPSRCAVPHVRRWRSAGTRAARSAPEPDHSADHRPAGFSPCSAMVKSL